MADNVLTLLIRMSFLLYLQLFNTALLRRRVHYDQIVDPAFEEIIYCAFHVLVQPNFRRYYFYVSPNQAQILLVHFNVLDEL